MALTKKKILLFADWYEPGFKAGGPIRSCVNFCDNMGSHYELFVFTTDRDHGDEEAYADVATDSWIDRKGIQIMYASPAQLNWKTIRRVVAKLNPDFIYLNSMFSRYMALYPLLMKRAGYTRAKLVLAPRGMLKQTALDFKKQKKSLFLKLFKALGLQRQVVFHATDHTESQDIQRIFGAATSCVQVANFPAAQKEFQQPIQKLPGYLKIIFVGRIHPIKNLLMLLQMLQPLQAQVNLTIVGTVEDELYWKKCRELIASLPEHIKIEVKENIPNHQIGRLIEDHHIFASPTQGENFGHAIFEALSAGRPVLISDQTPWRNLQSSKAGWDLNLTDADAFTEVLKLVAAMEDGAFQECCKGAWNLAHDYITNTDVKNQYLKLFS